MKKNQQEATEIQETSKVTEEEAFVQLTEIVGQMENPKVTLEESMDYYRKGMALLNQCKDTLDQIEKEMITLTEEGEVPDGEIR